MKTPATRASGKALMTGVLFIAALTGCCVSYAVPQATYKPSGATFRPVAVSEPTSDPTPSPAPSPVVGEPARPIGPLPTPRVVPPRQPKGEIGDAVVGGRASWYCCTRGYDSDDLVAAAGPSLRTGNWRGRVVRVCSDDTGRCVRLTLVDFCGCYNGTRRERVIDLHPGVVHALGLNLSQGVYRVTVTR